MNKNLRIAIVLVIILAIFSAGTYFYKQRPAEEKNNAGVCAADAFQCPDGSYVSRILPKCNLAPCAGSSLVGMLRRDANGFVLIFGSPGIDGGEVSYIMPLILNVTSDAEELVGRKVVARGFFIEGAKFSVNQLEKLEGDAGDPTLGEVAVGKNIFINGVLITLNSVVSDSRCPIDVQCIQAGSVKVNVTLKSNTDKETIDISSNAAPIAFDSFHVSIESIKPLPISTKNIKPEDYLIIFRVSSN